MTGEQVTQTQPQCAVPNAREVVRKCGIPTEVVHAVYAKMNVQVRVMNGSGLAEVWTPTDWATRPAHAKTTLVLNIWADHVSLYEPQMGKCAPLVPTENTWAEHVLEKQTKELDDHDYD